MLSDLRYRLRALFRRDMLDADLDEELRDHIERETEKLIRAGMNENEARRRPRIAFGGVEQARQRDREARGITLIEQMRQDLGYGIRSLKKNPGFVAVFVATLALGIGGCTAVFSLMNAVMFPPMPFGDVGRLVYVTTPNRNLSEVPLEALIPCNADFADMKRLSHSFSAMTQFEQRHLKLGGTGATIGTAAVDGDFFGTLESRPELGRAISAEDNQPANAGVVVISRSLSQQLFGDNQAALSKTVQLDKKTYRVIGVMAADFRFPRKADVDYGDEHFDETDAWIPLALTPQQRAQRGLDGSSFALGRLKDGVTTQQAADELSAIMKQLDPLHTPPAFKEGWFAYIKSYRQTIEGSARPLIVLLMGAVSFVLLIACANAANLLLARSASRIHELGVRATLGAGRNRLMRQMLTESLLLGLGGGLAGIAMAWVFLKLLLMLNPGDIPRLNEATLNAKVLAFAFAATLLTSVITGMLPALVASRVNLVEFLKSGGQTGAKGSRSRLRAMLISGEVAIVVVLLAGAGLLLRSFMKLEQVPVRFSSTTLSMKIDLPESYNKPETRRDFFKTLLSQIGASPGVLATGAVIDLPFGDTKGVGSFWIEGYQNIEGQMVDGANVTPDYFSAMSIPIVEGRSFAEEGLSGPPQEAIVNQALVKKYFAGRNPIGMRIWQSNPTGANRPNNDDARTIVGVVGDVRDWTVEAPPQPQLFTPLRDASDAYIVVRANLPREAILDSATAILKRIDRNMAFSKVHTMRELVSEATARKRFQTVLLSIFAAAALLLALVGFYGLMAYTVSQRSAEMGVRIALGARRRDIAGLVVRQGLRLVVAGLVLGMIAAFPLSRLLTSSLYEVKAWDPATFVVVPMLFMLVAFAACVIPARRAANADPMVILRQQ
jgi:predicted permease